ncbi:MAG: anti-sigma factor antagonist [Candidatus Eisenbacteria bacterium]|nr:anti-sigma factor antagonist [Candidatus Eisenbacteria bacterium]
MRISKDQVDDVWIIRLSGKLMGGPDADLVQEVVREGLSSGYKKLLLDLGDVSWVNSTGLGILITSHISVTNAGGVVKLMRVSRRIDSILMVTKLNTIFEVHDSQEAALASFRDDKAGAKEA